MEDKAGHIDECIKKYGLPDEVAEKTGEEKQK